MCSWYNSIPATRAVWRHHKLHECQIIVFRREYILKLCGSWPWVGRSDHWVPISWDHWKQGQDCAFCSLFLRFQTNAAPLRSSTLQNQHTDSRTNPDPCCRALSARHCHQPRCHSVHTATSDIYCRIQMQLISIMMFRQYQQALCPAHVLAVTTTSDHHQQINVPAQAAVLVLPAKASGPCLSRSETWW